MEETTQQSFDRLGSISSSGARDTDSHNVTEQPILPEDESFVTAHPSQDVAISGSSRIAKDRPLSSEKIGADTTVNQVDISHEQGYERWDEQSNYVNANNLHVIPPAIYNENPSLYFSPYGGDTQMAYGQFPAMPSPFSPIVIDGQLYSPHHFTSPYFQPSVSPGLPHVSSALGMSQADMMAPSATSGQENLGENFFGSGPGYYLPFGDLSGNGNLGYYSYPGEFGTTEQLQNQSSSLGTSRYQPPFTPGPVYQQPMAMFGSYEQGLLQQAPYQGIGYTPNQGIGYTPNSSSRHFPAPGSYQGSKYVPGSYTHWGGTHRNRFNVGGRHDNRDRDSLSYSTESLGISSERNRGPRASNPKTKNTNEDNNSSSTAHKDPQSVSVSDLQVDQYNSPEFSTEYENARFFVIKSFSEDNVHKSIKYGIWASTVMGNRKLDAAYNEAKELTIPCPIFLFFSVNASGQFCGLAEMVGPVDFENDAEYWQQDRWTGQFPVKWHIVKDVPNNRLRHILLDNNENKPVTHSRDSQEVKLEQGIEILKILKDYEAETSLVDDFSFYNECELELLKKKAKQRTGLGIVADSINQLSHNLSATLHLDNH